MFSTMIAYDAKITTKVTDHRNDLGVIGHVQIYLFYIFVRQQMAIENNVSSDF